MNNAANIYEIRMTAWPCTSSSSGHWCNTLTSDHVFPGGTPATRSSKHKVDTDLKLTPIYTHVFLSVSLAATLTTQLPLAARCCPHNSISPKEGPPKQYQWKGWRKKDQKEKCPGNFHGEKKWSFSKSSFWFLFPCLQQRSSYSSDVSA